MNNRWFLHILLLSVLLLGACAGLNSPSGAYVSGNTFAHVGYPPVAVTANAPFTLFGNGRLWVTLYNQDSLLTRPLASFDYAVFGDGSSGPVTRHAHMLFVQPTEDIWAFQLESFKNFGTLSLSKQDFGRLTWTMQIMELPAEGDWFSALWQENGRSVPETWLVKRFSATPSRNTRLVAEYREPWPECLPPGLTDLFMVSRSCLKEFQDRADAAFTLDDSQPGEMPTRTPSTALALPPFNPNTRKLVGEVWHDNWRIRR